MRVALLFSIGRNGLRCFGVNHCPNGGDHNVAVILISPFSLFYGSCFDVNYVRTLRKIPQASIACFLICHISMMSFLCYCYFDDELFP